ncbi:hypothetical protein GQX74_010284 [Glossina fuscipes]|nr:hypothetical protein GQX74_010284 [Glossina fuscipes]
MEDHLPQHQSTWLECSAFQYRYHLTQRRNYSFAAKATLAGETMCDCYATGTTYDQAKPQSQMIADSTQLPTPNRTKTENTTSSTTTLINHYSHVCIYTIRHMYDTLICCLHSQHMVGFRADCPPMAMLSSSLLYPLFTRRVNGNVFIEQQKCCSLVI